MQFSFEHSIAILERTPSVLEVLMKDLSDDWVYSNEGLETWSPFDVVGHLVHGEGVDWISRLEIILSDKEEKAFKPFDRFAQFEESKSKNINQILAEFKELRSKNMTFLKSKKLNEIDLSKTGIHPVFGEVTLRNLLSSWVVHDLDHISQITRVISFQYKDEVGPWKEYLRILNMGAKNS